MHFLKTLFWVVVAVVAAIFGYRNWVIVTVSLWGGLAADARLPILMLASFLLGFVPIFLLYRANRWRLRRRVEATQRSLDEARAQIAVLASDATEHSNFAEKPAPLGTQPEIL